MPEVTAIVDGTPIKLSFRERCTIGRGPDQDIRLSDGKVSRAHCRIVRHGIDFFLEALSASNPTQLIGEVVPDLTRLQHRDVVGVHGVELMFQVEDGDQQEDTPDIASFTQLEMKQPEEFRPASTYTSMSELQEDYDKLRISHEVAKSLAGSTDLDQVLDRMVGTFQKLLGADRGELLLLDEAGVLAPRGGSSGGYSTTIARMALENSAALLSGDAQADARFAAAKSVMVQEIRATMAAPIEQSGRQHGVLVLDSQNQTSLFTDKDLGLLRTGAAQAGVALNNVDLAQRLAEEAVMRAQFSRLLAPNLVDHIVDQSLTVIRQGELRPVTTLFGDLRGFTSFSETRSPTEVVAMLNDYFEVMVEILFRHEGTLDKFVGDEVMGLFGAPVAHEDDPVRAVRTAIEMQQAMVALNAEWARRGVPQLTAGIGINTGEVTAGFIGSGRALSYTVIGDAVNTAARMCDHATGGQILIGRQTWEQVRDQFETQEVPALSAKNKKDPVAVWQVVF